MMKASPFILVAPSSRGLSLAITRHFLRTTKLPVYATHRSDDPDAIRKRILSSLPDTDPGRLHLLHLELTSESSISSAADKLADTLPKDHTSYLHTAFLTGGILHPERQPADLDAGHISQTFQINVVSHLLLIKHFSRFLPAAKTRLADDTPPAKWVHVTARVGSVSDNRLGGWYSYRASKAALNQIIRTYDLYLQRKKTPAICVGVHPGTVKTDFSKEFWGGVPEGKLFEPAYAAERLVEVVGKLDEQSRGRIWDWAGKEVLP
ncbi:NAD(P)-binding protein, partial [Wolfiporia cocos MD-104 SS10]